VYCHAIKFLKASSLNLRMLPHVLKMTAREPQKLIIYSSDVMVIDATSIGEPTTPNVVSMISPSDSSIKVQIRFTVDFLLEGPNFPLYLYHHLHRSLQLQKKGTPMNRGYGCKLIPTDTESYYYWSLNKYLFGDNFQWRNQSYPW